MFSHARVGDARVVVDGDAHEMVFDHPDECGIAEDFGPEALAAASSRNLLKQGEYRFARVFCSL